jgi:thioredoxin-related protein
MKKIVFLLITVFFFTTAWSQPKAKVNLYNPKADAAKELDSVIALAKKENKQVLVQIGGNWCSWCIKLHNFVETNGDLKRAITMDYVTYKLNYSVDNTNKSLLEKYKHPERFGFPVLLILDSEGNLLHTQDSSLLEKGDGYDKERLFQFVKGWTARAVAGKE